MKKWISLLLVIIIVCAVFYLTLQNAEETNALTYQTMEVLEKIGLNIRYKPLRHYIHYFEYFVVGLLISNLLLNYIWKCPKAIWISMLFGVVVGTIDEVIKIWLPIREFDLGDLTRDYVGTIVGVLISAGVSMTIKKVKNDNTFES